MAVTFVAAGSIADNATVPTQAIVGPACNVGDLLIAVLINKSAVANTISPPAGGGWNQIIQGVNDCTTAADDHEYAVFWKIAAASGASYSFTKATDDNVTFGGYITAWRGHNSVLPMDATPANAKPTAGAADAVSFNSYDPTDPAHVVFIAYYGNDLTTFAAAMSADTNPDCTKWADLESTTGTDYTIAICSGDSDGSLIAARTWASVSTTDAGNTGIVFGIAPSVPVTVTPGVGQLTLTGIAPAVPVTVAAAVGVLTLTGLAPTVIATNATTVEPGVGALTLTGLAPTVPVVIAASTGQLTLDGFAPTLPVQVTPGVGQLTLTGIAPQLPILASPGVGQLSLAGLAPTIPTTIAAGTGQLTLAGLEPTLLRPVTVTPGTGELILEGFAPDLPQVVSDPVTVTTGTGQLTLTGFAPLLPVVISTGIGQLNLTGIAPSIPVTITPGTGELLLSGLAPTLPVIAVTGTGELVLSGLAPLLAIATGTIVTTGTGELLLEGFAPVLLQPVTVVAGVGELALTGIAPTLGSAVSMVLRVTLQEAKTQRVIVRRNERVALWVSMEDRAGRPVSLAGLSLELRAVTSLFDDTRRFTSTGLVIDPLIGKVDFNLTSSETAEVRNLYAAIHAEGAGVSRTLQLFQLDVLPEAA